MNINHFKFIIWSKEKIDFGLYPEPDPTKNCCYSISGKIKPGEIDGASPSDPNNSLLSMKQWCLVFKKSPTTIFIDFTQKEGPKSNHKVYLEIRDKAGDKSEVFYTTYFNFPVGNGCTSDRGEFKIEDISKPYALTVSRNKDSATTDWNIIIYGDDYFDMNEIESNHKLRKSVPKYKPKNVDLKPMFFPQIQQIEQHII